MVKKLNKIVLIFVFLFTWFSFLLAQGLLLAQEIKLEESVIKEIPAETEVAVGENISAYITLEEIEGDTGIVPEKLSKEALAQLRSRLDDLFFNIGTKERPTGLITSPLPKKRGPVILPGQPIQKPKVIPGKPVILPGQPIQKPKVIPGENVIIDEDNGRIIQIPPSLNCVWHTEHHRTDDGTEWVFIVHIKNGQFGWGQIDVFGGPKGKFKGRRRRHIPIKIKKVHKDNNKITVIGEDKNGKPKIVIYDVKHNVGRVKYKKNAKWKWQDFSL